MVRNHPLIVFLSRVQPRNIGYRYSITSKHTDFYWKSRFLNILLQLKFRQKYQKHEVFGEIYGPKKTDIIIWLQNLSPSFSKNNDISLKIPGFTWKINFVPFTLSFQLIFRRKIPFLMEVERKTFTGCIFLKFGSQIFDNKLFTFLLSKLGYKIFLIYLH